VCDVPKRQAPRKGGDPRKPLKVVAELPKKASQHGHRRVSTEPRDIEREEVNSLIEYLSRLIADLKEEKGQTMAEYAVVLGVITIAVVVTLGLLSTKISSVLNSVITSM
jgi:Flp pilus assembly pilin Flp